MTSYLNEALIPDLDRDGATQAGKSMCKRMGICKGAQNWEAAPRRHLDFRPWSKAGCTPAFEPRPEDGVRPAEHGSATPGAGERTSVKLGCRASGHLVVVPAALPGYAASIGSIPSLGGGHVIHLWLRSQ